MANSRANSAPSARATSSLRSAGPAGAVICTIDSARPSTPRCSRLEAIRPKPRGHCASRRRRRRPGCAGRGRARRPRAGCRSAIHAGHGDGGEAEHQAEEGAAGEEADGEAAAALRRGGGWATRTAASRAVAASSPASAPGWRSASWRNTPSATSRFSCRACSRASASRSALIRSLAVADWASSSTSCWPSAWLVLDLERGEAVVQHVHRRVADRALGEIEVTAAGVDLRPDGGDLAVELLEAGPAVVVLGDHVGALLHQAHQRVAGLVIAGVVGDFLEIQHVGGLGREVGLDRHDLGLDGDAAFLHLVLALGDAVEPVGGEHDVLRHVEHVVLAAGGEDLGLELGELGAVAADLLAEDGAGVAGIDAAAMGEVGGGDLLHGADGEVPVGVGEGDADDVAVALRLHLEVGAEARPRRCGRRTSGGSSRAGGAGTAWGRGGRRRWRRWRRAARRRPG